ncbi:MAG TPA: nucleoside triphosphate pyrophosphatase [Steroidobacteraceae bacterium]|nr:nucleoside triphosphate pyrophosphatase [Steroidobacteraceae bacterium]
MPALILASTSPYRRALLERLGLAFEVMRPDAPEDHLPREMPRDRALRLSTAKAKAVATLRPDAVVIGSDQVAALGSRVLDKPGDAANCASQLALLSGATARFHTGCAVIANGERLVHLDTTTVTFRALSTEEIARYVERERPFDCAGGFKAEALGVSLLEGIESKDPTALIGLPLIWLASALRSVGYSLP